MAHPCQFCNAYSVRGGELNKYLLLGLGFDLHPDIDNINNLPGLLENRPNPFNKGKFWFCR